MNETKIPDFVRRAERLLVKRGGKHFSGNKVTNDFFQVKKKSCGSVLFDPFKLSWADVAMFYTLKCLTDPTDPFITKYQKNKLGDARLKCLDNAPHLTALVQAVGEQPNIKKWMEDRPGNEAEAF